MSGSYIFYLHLVGFGLLSAAVIGGWVLNMKFMAEQDLIMKIFIGGIMRTMGILFPLSVLILFVTGVGNIFNLYVGTPNLWYQQGWLVIKIILFAVLLVNGILFGPLLTRKRLRVAQMLRDQADSELEKQFKELNKQVTWFFVVQAVLLLGIIFFSAFGTSKHPGYF